MPIKNIFLITIDCWRYDHLTPETNPFIYSLKNRAQFFANAFATGPFTSASFPSILGGINPLEYGYYAPLPKQAKLIPEVLKKHGFYSIGVNSNPYLSSFFGYHRGFDAFEDFISYEQKSTRRKSNPIVKLRDFIIKRSGPYSTAYRLLSRLYLALPIQRDVDLSYQNAEKTLTHTKKLIEEKNSDAPLFVWTHLMDAHTPYNPPAKFLDPNFAGDIAKLNLMSHQNPEFINEQTLNQLKQLYCASLRYIDEQFENFFNHLEAEGLLDESLIILTSDHGEEFLEHDGITHFAKLYDELIHVPLFILDPNKPAQVIEHMVSLKGIPATIYDRVEHPAEIKDNNSLLHPDYPTSQPFVFGECTYKKYDNFFEERSNKYAPQKRKYFIRNKKWKLIIDEDKQQEWLYDLVNDPDEKLAVKDEPDIQSSLRQVLLQYQQNRK